MGVKLDDKDQLAVANYIVQFYLENKSVPSIAVLSEACGLNAATLEGYYADRAFRGYLRESSGLDFDDIFVDPTTVRGKLRSVGALTPQQLLVINAMMDPNDTRSDKKKLQDFGIHSLTYNAWLRDPAIQKYMRTIAEGMFGDNRHLASNALLAKVKQGDMKAIEYYNEMMGIFTPRRGGQSAVNELDMKQILMRVVEIIQIRVSDPSLQKVIADDLKQLGQQHLIAQQAMIVETQTPVRELPRALELSDAV